MEYKNNNEVYFCKYHVVWRPKYRRKVLVNGVDVRRWCCLSPSITSSLSKKETMVIAEIELNEGTLCSSISATDYEAGSIRKKPWEKTGLFGR